ncbi:unnamed protein product, partial [Oikopleura dioica]
KYDSSSDFFLRDHTDGSLVSTTKLSGYKKSEFSEEKTGINWCKGSPNKLSPAYRLKEYDGTLTVGCNYSTAATICLPKNY